MKKTYINPKMNISVFEAENVVTASGATDEVTAAEYIVQNQTAIFGEENVSKLKKVIVF